MSAIISTADVPLTTADLSTRYGVPQWRLRRIIDSFGVAVPRVCRVRVVAPELLPRIEAELRRLGCLADAADPEGVQRAS